MKTCRTLCNLALSALLAAGLACPAPAAETKEISGVPIVQDASSLMLDGKRIYLWGIEPLANDQQCWMGERAWHCGEQASIALKHFAEGHRVRCVIKTYVASDALLAQCFRQGRGKETDIAAYMVSHGWALDRPALSGGLYEEAQDKAEDEENGAWTSRFQTPEDWQEGVQRFVGEESDEAPTP